MQEAFLRACQNGDLETVERLVECSEADWRNSTGNTALMLACATGQEVVVRLLLERQYPDVSATNARGDTALLFSCVCGKASVVRLMLDQKRVAVDAVNAGGMDALAAALLSSHADRALSALLVLGKRGLVPPTATHLRTAIQADNLSGAELLIFAGAQVTAELLQLADKKPQICSVLRAWLKKQESVAAVFEEQLMQGRVMMMRPYELSDLIQGPLLKVIRAEMTSNASVRVLVEAALAERWVRGEGKTNRKEKKKKPKKVPAALLEAAEAELSALKEALRRQDPHLEAADVGPRHALGELDSSMSAAQLELLRLFHLEQLRRVEELIRGAEVSRLVDMALQQAGK
jgi:hypothetical protein